MKKAPKKKHYALCAVQRLHKSGCMQKGANMYFEEILEEIKKTFLPVLTVIKLILFLIPVAITIFTVVTVTSLDKNDRSVFGMKFFIVQSDSMSLSENNKDMDIHFNAGDIVIIKKAAKNQTYKEGDIISFISTNTESYMKTVTHMIREVKTDGEGKVTGYVTYGTNTGKNDRAVVLPDNVIGSYMGKVPKAGNLFSFLKSPDGYVKCILIPFLIMVFYYSLSIIWYYRKYKRLEEEGY